MKDCNNTNIFVAIPEAVVCCGETAYQDIYSSELSGPLGYFLVKPIRKFRFFREYDGELSFGMTTVGFSEVNTGRKIISRTFQRGKLGDDQVLQHDVLADVKPAIGDVYWKVDDLHPASELLSVKELQDYLSLTKGEIIEQLYDIHEKAIELGAQYKERIKQKIK